MKELTRQDTQQLRGFAILLIIVHNFCHLLPGVLTENEFIWQYTNILHSQVLLHGELPMIFNLFSYYGFYGISIFVFLCGYGLASKYDNLEDLSLVHYLIRHATKLWRLLFLGILLYYIAFRFLGGDQPSWDHIVKLSTFVANLLPHRTLIFGPWWWFSLIMQFYVVYFFFYYKRRLRTISIFTLLCLLLQVAVTFYCRHDLTNEQSSLVFLHYNFPALVLPFTLGVYASRRQPSWLGSPFLLIVSIIIVILSSYNVWIWCLSSVFACIVLINLGHFLCLTNWSSACFSWLGKVSAWAFVIHPIVRRYAFWLYNTQSLYFILVLYLFLTLGLSFVMYKIMAYIDRKPEYAVTQ